MFRNRMSGVLCHPLRAKKAIISVSALEFGSVSIPPLTSQGD